jgi:hypothetical protein
MLTPRLGRVDCREWIGRGGIAALANDRAPRAAAQRAPPPDPAADVTTEQGLGIAGGIGLPLWGGRTVGGMV